jgi:chemotaxis protein MotB
MSFFVMLVAFSSQDATKAQMMAGSMRDAFGVQPNPTLGSGISEVEGLSTRSHLKQALHIPPEQASANPQPNEHDRFEVLGSRLQPDHAFALAAASLRQMFQGMPELTEISRHIVVAEVKQGLNVEIVDQDGRSMFPAGAAEPYDRTRRLIEKIARPLRAAPYRIVITGHTSRPTLPAQLGTGPWDLSVGRANAVRRILAGSGVPETQFYMASGKADTEPLYPEDPYNAANRRITITLMREEPVMPLGFRP